MCRRFGEDVYIAGSFSDKEDFDIYYQGLYQNEKFIRECSFVDNGRLLTWIPYSRNSERLKGRNKMYRFSNRKGQYFIICLVK